jgi:hypothetical protein
MANIMQQGRKPATGHGLMLPYLVAGLIGITCAGLVGRSFESPAAIPAMNLHQAVSDFDAGNLRAATAAFRTLANAGDPHAAYWYGHALDLGLGTPVNVKAAITQYENAWAGGVTLAGTRLGELYLNGNAIPPDFAQARSYLTEAARRGDARAETASVVRPIRFRPTRGWKSPRCVATRRRRWSATNCFPHCHRRSRWRRATRRPPICPWWPPKNRRRPPKPNLSLGGSDLRGRTRYA